MPLAAMELRGLPDCTGRKICLTQLAGQAACPWRRH